MENNGQESEMTARDADGASEIRNDRQESRLTARNSKERLDIVKRVRSAPNNNQESEMIAQREEMREKKSDERSEHSVHTPEIRNRRPHERKTRQKIRNNESGTRATAENPKSAANVPEWRGASSKSPIAYSSRNAAAGSSDSPRR